LSKSNRRKHAKEIADASSRKKESQNTMKDGLTSETNRMLLKARREAGGDRAELRSRSRRQDSRWPDNREAFEHLV
jgi:hypothetical protein